MSALQPRIFRGDRLKELRKTAGLSQGQLGQRIAAHVTSISDWERGETAPSGRHLAGLARELGVDAESFYGADDDEEPHPVVSPVEDLKRAFAAFVDHTAMALRP